LSGVLKLADWARLLVEHWKEWTHAFWVWAFGWLGIHLEPKRVPVLTFLSFGSLLTIGQAFQFQRGIRDQANVDQYQQKSFRLNLWRSLVCVVLMMAASLFIWRVIAEDYLPEKIAEMAFFVALIAPLVIIVLLSKERLHAALSVVLTVLFFIVIAMEQFRSMVASADDISSISRAVVIAVYLTWVLPLILLSVAPAKAVSRRLIFLALGLLLLLALNELSKLGLDVTAPKLQG
jgi:hypothetical protein